MILSNLFPFYSKPNEVDDCWYGAILRALVGDNGAQAQVGLDKPHLIDCDRTIVVGRHFQGLASGLVSKSSGDRPALRVTFVAQVKALDAFSIGV